MKPHQQADRQSGAAHLLDIERAELPLEKSPVDFIGQRVQGVSSVEHVLQTGAEQFGLSSGIRGRFRMHLSPGIHGIYFYSRELSHKSHDMKSLYFQ